MSEHTRESLLGAKKEKCYDCDGSGQEPDWNDDGSVRSAKCGKCNGTGIAATPKAAVESAEGGAYALEQGIAAARAAAKNTSNPMDTASWNACLDFVIDSASATQATEPCAGKGAKVRTMRKRGDSEPHAWCPECVGVCDEVHGATPPAAAPVEPVVVGFGMGCIEVQWSDGKRCTYASYLPAHWREAMRSYEIPEGSIDAIERTTYELAAKERGS